VSRNTEDTFIGIVLVGVVLFYLACAVGAFILGWKLIEAIG
jgi:hypothetical protein